MVQEQDTEQRIFDSARSVFFEHGFDGARMAEIARRAGINQSMLHYYFRSKTLLFDAVFKKAAMEALPPVLVLLVSDLPIPERFEKFAQAYLEMIAHNPHLPAFILQELRRNPDGLRHFASSALEGVFIRVAADIEAAARRGEIKPVDPNHLFANLLGLCIFPYIARPMLQAVFEQDDSAYDRFLEERQREVTDFIRHALRP